MATSVWHLVVFAWHRCAEMMGTTLYGVLFSILAAVVVAVWILKRNSGDAMSLKDNFKKSWKEIFIASVLAPTILWLLLLIIMLPVTIYKEHENLKSRIRELHKRSNHIETSVRPGTGLPYDAFGNPGKTVGPTEMNFGVMNYGPLPAKDVSIKAKIFWSPPLNKADEEKKWNDFIKQSSSHPEDLDVNNNDFSTFTSDPLTEKDLADIRDNKLIFYIFRWWTYTDGGGTHATEECRILQLPLPKTGFGTIWHPCIRGGTKIR